MMRLAHPAARRSAALPLASAALALPLSAPRLRHGGAVQLATRALSSAAPCSDHGGACPSRLAGAEVSAVSGRRRFDPREIYPSQVGVVRICNNTIRDAQQSNLSAEMAHKHRVQVATLIDQCYASTKGPPGVEQIWGGTVPMFDIWKRGVHPFDGLREVTALLPNTPTSMLVRSNSLNSMSAQPRDVVDAFIAHSAAAGIDVFTNFDAHNDLRNHGPVAEAVHKAGRHYQAALSWAVCHSDPTIYNVQWAVQWFRDIVKNLDPHSLYVKDPSGVLTPEMAGLVARELKAEFPHLPLIFHSHYQSGFAYATYLEALRCGANGVECSLGFPDGAGQPYSLSLLRMAEEYGLDTGNPDKAAWTRVSKLCRTELLPLYPNANVVRVPDVSVEQNGIAGGQRSILDKELRDAGQAELIPQVDKTVQVVRRQGGMVCQVTPSADSFAREAMRRLRGGPSDKGFAPGYAQILVGECGSTKEPVDADQRRTAIDERAQRRLRDMLAEGRLPKAAADALHGVGSKNDLPFAQTPLGLWRARMDELAAPVLAHRRLAEVKERLEELAIIAKRPELLASLERKVAMAAAHAEEGAPEQQIHCVADRVAVLQLEAASLEGCLQNQPSAADAAASYESLLLGSADTSVYESFISLSPLSEQAHRLGSLSVAHVRDLLPHCGAITCDPSLLLEPGLDRAAREIEAFESEQCLGLLDTPRKRAENTLLWACYSRAAIPNMLANFMEHYYTADMAGFFPPLFKGDKSDGRTGTLKATLAKAAEKTKFLYRQIHRHIEGVLHAQKGSAALVSRVRALTARADLLDLRLAKWNDGSAESARVDDVTRERLQQLIAGLRAEARDCQTQLEQVVLQHLKLHPGELQQTFPLFDEASTHVAYANLATAAAAAHPASDEPEGAGSTVPAELPSVEEDEYQTAKVALQQIIHH